MEHFELIVLGGGPGGYVAAIRAAHLGHRVALVEENALGGTCLNRGCIPTKALLHSASLYRKLKEGAELGVLAEGLSFDPEALYHRKDAVSAQLREGIAQLMKANKITVFSERGQLTAADTVTLAGGECLTAERILLATGSVPAVPPIPGHELAGVCTSDGLLASPPDFSPLVIIGGGVIGVEFSSVWSSLGVPVTVLEAADRLLPNLDREFGRSLAMTLTASGAQIFTGALVRSIEAAENGLLLRFTHKNEEKSVPAARVLVATGRRPNSAGIFAEGCAPEMDRAAVRVDDHFSTSIPGVYAVGDLTGGIQLAHVASAQGIAAVEHMFGHEPSVRLDLIPGCVYTNPEIASVGLDADAAKAAGVAVLTGKALTGANGRSIIDRQPRGFVKLVFVAADERLIGAQLMCARATDLIAELATAIAAGVTREKLAGVVRAHPTFAELVTEAAEDAAGMATHAAPRRR